jgi:hypothetical protein
MTKYLLEQLLTVFHSLLRASYAILSSTLGLYRHNYDIKGDLEVQI